MCNNDHRPKMQGLSDSRNRSGQSGNDEGSGSGLLMGLGGLALVGAAGVAAYIYFNSNNEPQVRAAHENRHVQNQNVQDQNVQVQELRQAVSERFRTRSLTNEECAICTEPLHGLSREELCVLICGHFFHKSCYEKWENSKGQEGNCPTCPICRMRDPANVTGLNPHRCCQ